MKLYLDEGIAPPVARALFALGIDAKHASELGLRGVADVSWIPVVAKEGRIIVTTDKRLRHNRDERAALETARSQVVVLQNQPSARDAAAILLMQFSEIKRMLAQEKKRPTFLKAGKRNVSRWNSR